MDKIVNLLKTPEGAQALKAKLKGMPENEKAKENYKKIWTMVCTKVNEYNVQKMKQKQSAQTQVKPKDKKAQKPSEVKQQEASNTQKDKPQKKNDDQVKTKSKWTQKPKFKQPQFSEQDITTMIVRLERNYPKLFDAENPKPLKVGIFDDILEKGDWDANLLKAAIRTYARSELYYLSFANDTSRYDLLGERTSAISLEDEQHAIDRLKRIVGRFNLPDKYPQLVGRDNNMAPEPVKSKFYGFHYYEEKRFFEVKEILAECYGSSVKIKHKDTKVDELFCSEITVKYKEELLFHTEAKSKLQRAAQKLVSVKLLIHLQNNIEAYPFPYKKLNLSDDEIERQFFDYYQAKHGDNKAS